MNRFSTGLTVLAVVAGPPLAAAVWLHRHPWHPPSGARIRAWAEQPLTAGTIITGCVIIAGTGWLLLVAYLAHRTVTVLRHRRHRTRHLALPTPAQLTARSMAGVAALALPAAPIAHHPPPVAATGTPQPADVGVPESDVPDHATGQPEGFALPGGGWIPYRTAATITVLSAAVWLSRRRRYRPDPDRPRHHRDDADLQPLPATVHAVTTALDETPPEDLPRPALAADQLPQGNLYLTGPGAARAARGLLVTGALTRAAAATTVAVLARPADLRTLFPGRVPAELVMAGIRTSGSQRQHMSRDRDTLAVTVIHLGQGTAADHCWHVTADGTATGTGLAEPRRLCSLDPNAATDLLTLASPRPTAADPQPQLPADAGPEPATSGAGFLSLLGGCRLAIADEAVHLSRTAGLQTLAYLAVHPRGATGRELCQAMWPHLPAAAIRQRLHTTLADLRKQLRPLLGDDPVVRRDDRYLLNAIRTDLQPWRAAENTLTHTAGAARLDACRALIDLYRGELGAGWTWPWLTPAREQIRRSIIDAYATLATNTEPDEARALLQQAIGVDPHNESLHHHLAALSHDAGGPAATTATGE